MITKYDPMRAPDPAKWRQTDETQRILVVERFHRKAGFEMPNHRIHAAIHAVVENQIAEGETIPVKETLERLMGEGLDRHDALHAIGSVLAELMHGMMSEPDKGGDPNPGYYAALRELTAESWKTKYGDDGEDS